MKTQQIEAKIAELAQQAKALQAQIDNFELDPEYYADQYDEMLDDAHGDFLGMNASSIVKEMDPTAYRCGLLDYLDSLDQDEEKMNNDECLELFNQLEEIENEIEELEEELAELEGLDND
jgi:predicted transcriptional regulator